MILEKIDRPVIKSIDLQSNKYHIDDAGMPMVFSILRKNMYTTPKRIIFQEYANNARDTHVAIGTPDLPIKVYTPTAESPYLKIQDFGPGMNPDEIKNTFLSYGASTKRHTNEYIGSFGLGAKS